MRNTVAKFLGTIAVALIAVTASGCSGGAKGEVVPSDTDAEAVVTVTVVDNRYEPAEVEIQAGEAVRWVFAGSMEHDVVAEDGSFVSELMVEGEYVHRFDEAGEFAYDCSLHPEMTGVVTVK